MKIKRYPQRQVSPRPALGRASAVTPEGRITVELACEAPQAEEVFVAGDFNEWRPRDVRLRKDSTGVWKAELWLTPGRHEYRFVVDGRWQNDPQAPASRPDQFGSTEPFIIN